MSKRIEPLKGLTTYENGYRKINELVDAVNEMREAMPVPGVPYRPDQIVVDTEPRYTVAELRNEYVSFMSERLEAHIPSTETFLNWLQDNS